jgi:hypothetical protein
MISVRLKLRALAYPPYFIRFMRRSPVGDLELLLRALTPVEEAQLNAFEAELREAHRFEQLNELEHAIDVYEQIIERYPKFAFVLTNHLESVRKARISDFVAHAAEE